MHCTDCSDVLLVYILACMLAGQWMCSIYTTVYYSVCTYSCILQYMQQHLQAYDCVELGLFHAPTDGGQDAHMMQNLLFDSFYNPADTVATQPTNFLILIDSAELVELPATCSRVCDACHSRHTLNQGSPADLLLCDRLLRPARGSLEAAAACTRCGGGVGAVLKLVVACRENGLCVPFVLSMLGGVL